MYCSVQWGVALLLLLLMPGGIKIPGMRNLACFYLWGFKKFTHSEFTRLLLHSVPGVPVWPFTHALHLFYHDSLSLALSHAQSLHLCLSYKHAITHSLSHSHPSFIHFFTIEHSHPSFSLSSFIHFLTSLSRILRPVSLFHSSSHVWLTHSLILSRMIHSLTHPLTYDSLTNAHFIHQAPFIHYLFHPLFSCKETCNKILQETRTVPFINISFRRK